MLSDSPAIFTDRIVAAADADTSGDDGSDSAEARSNGVEQIRVHGLSEDDIEKLIAQINQEGDMLFRDAHPSGTGGSVTGWSFLYAKDYSHLGLWSGDDQIFDANDIDCAATRKDDDGVTLRPIGDFFNSGDEIMFAQLEDTSLRAIQATTPGTAERYYGTTCHTGFTSMIFQLWNNKMFCSKLVWRTYKDRAATSVNLNSNSSVYLAWLTQ